jgi:autotransporter-associated beta strand protein
LGGTNTDANEIRGVISDHNTAGGGLVSVTKVGSGLWILSGSNSYSGSTTIGGTTGSSNGVLRIASVSSLPPNTTIVGSAGTDTISTLELAPGSYSVKNYNKGNINFAATSGQATLEFTNTAVTNILTQGSGNKTIYASNVAVRFAGSLDISAVADAGLNKTATFSGNSDFTFDGPIIGPVVTNWTVVGTNGSNSIITTLTSNTNTIVSTNYFTPGFVMNSTGVAVLNAANTYAGATDVKQGTLQVNGSISTNTLNISNGATLAGLGTVGGDVFVSGNLQPGRGATNGALSIRGNLTVASNGIVNLSIDSLAEYDRLAGAISNTVDGTINVAASTNYSPANGNIFQLFSGAIGGAPTLNVTPLSNPNYVWVTNDFISAGRISVASTTPVLTPYDSWLTNYPGITNFPGGTSNTNGTADPDGDGYNNNIEFAFDGNPTVGTPALISAASSGTATLFSFLASTNTAAVSYMVQSTTNLATVPWADNSGVTATITNSANQTNPTILLAPSYVRREFTVTPAGSKSFYRVKATIAP